MFLLPFPDFPSSLVLFSFSLLTCCNLVDIFCLGADDMEALETVFNDHTPLFPLAFALFRCSYFAMREGK